MRLTNSTKFFAFVLFSFSLSPAVAGEMTLISGLRLPVKVILTPERNLLVAEAGDAVPNTGRISRVDQAGNRLSVIDGLPSGPAPDNVQGPAGLVLSNPKLLLVAIGTWDATAGVPGAEIGNPQGPSSPIFSSVIQVHFSEPVDELESGFNMTLDDHFILANGFSTVLENSESAEATLTLVTDFRDIVRDLDTGEPVRSNPFGLAAQGNPAYVADASRNSLEEVDLTNGRATRLVELEPIANPLPFGPPLLEPVPTGLTRFGNDLLVALETGFPFPAGVAEIRRVDPRTGEVTPFITGLTQALDVLPVRLQNPGFQFYVLELSVDLLSGAPGRLLFFSSPTAAPVVVSDTLSFPSSVARDEVTGDLFVTESLLGNIVVISP